MIPFECKRGVVDSDRANVIRTGAALNSLRFLGKPVFHANQSKVEYRLQVMEGTAIRKPSC